jgi:hypothetical protein
MKVNALLLPSLADETPDQVNEVARLRSPIRTCCRKKM